MLRAKNVKNSILYKKFAQPDIFERNKKFKMTAPAIFFNFLPQWDQMGLHDGLFRRLLRKHSHSDQLVANLFHRTATLQIYPAKW